DGHAGLAEHSTFVSDRIKVGTFRPNLATHISSAPRLPAFGSRCRWPHSHRGTLPIDRTSRRVGSGLAQFDDLARLVLVGRPGTGWSTGFADRTERARVPLGSDGVRSERGGLAHGRVPVGVREAAGVERSAYGG